MTKNLEALFCTISLRVGGQSISKAVSILFVIHGARDGLTRHRNYYCWARAGIWGYMYCTSHKHTYI